MKNNKCPHYDSILGTCNLYTVEEDVFDCLEEVYAKCKDIENCEYKDCKDD